MERFVREKIAAMSCGERVCRMAALMQSGRELIKASIRAQFPEFSEQQVFERFAQRTLGNELADKFLAHLQKKDVDV